MISLKKILNEIKIVSGNPTMEQGKIYDLRMWYAFDSPEDVYTSMYDVYPGTIRGKEGWYWSKGWKFLGWENDNTYRFEDTSNIGDIIEFPEPSNELTIKKSQDSLDEIKVVPKQNWEAIWWKIFHQIALEDFDVTPEMIDDDVEEFWTQEDDISKVTNETFQRLYGFSIDDISLTEIKIQTNGGRFITNIIETPAINKFEEGGFDFQTNWTFVEDYVLSIQNMADNEWRRWQAFGWQDIIDNIPIRYFIDKDYKKIDEFIESQIDNTIKSWYSIHNDKSMRMGFR